MRRANRGGELQILADGEVLIERVLLRNVTDVALELIEIRIKRLAVEQDLAAGRLQLPGQHLQQRAFAGAARAHHANQLAARDSEGNALQPDIAAAEAMRDLAHLEGANDVALFLDDALGKIAAQELPDIDADGVAILQRRGRCARRSRPP